ncbi:MAG: acyl-CoA ligase (AMP-forming), exosortase A system-associated [Alphaproteobacteria bacterium]|nr:acyl-CoA ligase (AMP-forming), exosortase A system-associated [Alphaproteobacteria bacterium]
MTNQSSPILVGGAKWQISGRPPPNSGSGENVASLPFDATDRHPDQPALRFDGGSLSYAEFTDAIRRAAAGLVELGLNPGDRVAIYLEKGFEAVTALFAAVAADGVFVPINPLLKPQQVEYILRDCDVRVLVTSALRLESLRAELSKGSDLDTVVLIGDTVEDAFTDLPFSILLWPDAMAIENRRASVIRRQADDVAAILYTSGSTGSPKGVMVSHRNLCVGAQSVATYLENNESDRLLSVLPLSFDAGLSQLTTAFYAGACCVLVNYLLPRDIVRICASERITGITGVSPLWIQLAQLEWPSEASDTLRYFANTGGHMPRATLDRLRDIFPKAKPFLMYGLTEAFRSTYLNPDEVDRRPDSIGKAIPNAEILVARPDGSLCEPGEIGELVHCGPLVALGYWNDPARTAERFRPRPGLDAASPDEELAVWSGDFVRADDEGFLYFIGRRDDMIKTSGYRVSPTEVEEVAYTSGLVGEAVALGIAHPVLGQAIVVAATSPPGGRLDVDALLALYRRELPGFMVPHRIVERAALPRSANGKIERKALAVEFAQLFSEIET